MKLIGICVHTVCNAWCVVRKKPFLRTTHYALLFLFLLTACERPSNKTSAIPIQLDSSSTLKPTPTLHINIVSGATAVPGQNNQSPALESDILSRLIPCRERTNANDLIIYIDKQYPVSRDYVPPDLVDLAIYVPGRLILGEHYMRQEAAEALGQMVEAMVAEDLQPTILSAYRDFNLQAASYAKWQREQPERADVISARPGSSEHQLGTTVDFGSPELVRLVGPNFQFHQQFANTSEGEWLADNAHHYGFTLSYPEASFSITGYEYEPWHFRYIGIENATSLYEADTLLLAWQAENLQAPCIP